MKDDMFRTIAEHYRTPAYVFDLDTLIKRVQMIRSHLGNHVKICYAMKANPFLITSLRSVVDCYEVCSPGEFRICEKNDIPMERVVLSGVYKERQDILSVMEKNGTAGVYTIESKEQLELIEACAKEKELRINALIRVTSGNQFGLDEEEICEIIRERESYSHVVFIGLQQYTGTQKKKMSKIKGELLQLDAFITLLQEAYGFLVKELEYGPGFYVPYFQTDDEVDDGAVLDEFADILAGLKFQGKITLEMGRYIAAYCGYYVTKTVDKKRNHGQNYCMIDGGIHHLSYFGQAMAMKMPYYRHICQNEVVESAKEKYTVCGALCTVNDVIIKNLLLRDALIGDILVFERVGAYAVTEGISLFLSRDLPTVMAWSKEEGMQVLRAQAATYTMNGGGKSLI